MFTEHLPTLGQEGHPLTASSAENSAYRNENRSVTTPYVALDRAPANPVLCFLNGNATYAVPLTIGQPYSSLPPYYAHLLRTALQTDCPYALEEWLDEQWLMALATKRYVQPEFYASSYLGDGIALLTRKGVRCYHPDVTPLPSQRVITPFYAPHINVHGCTVDSLVTLIDQSLPYAEDGVTLLRHIPLDHATHPELMRWFIACAQVAGLPSNHWAAKAAPLLPRLAIV